MEVKKPKEKPKRKSTQQLSYGLADGLWLEDEFQIITTIHLVIWFSAFAFASSSASASMDSFTRKYLQCEIPQGTHKGFAPDMVMRVLGFQVHLASSQCVSGHLTVTQHCCQPFNGLHGGVTALIAEGLASIGAHIASGFKRIAGIELNINHLNAASLGMTLYASAKPISMGKRVQVWEVKFWKIPASDVSSQIDPSTLPQDSFLAISRVTFLVGLPMSSRASRAKEAIKIPSSI